MTWVTVPDTAEISTNGSCSGNATGIREVYVVIEEQIAISGSTEDDEDGRNIELEDGMKNLELITPEESTGPEEGTRTLPQKALLRVYFDHEKDKYIPKKEEMGPIPIKGCSRFEVSVSTSSLRAGWYWAVFYVSLKGVAEGMLNNMVFDFTRTQMKTGTARTKEYNCSTFVTKDEIAMIPKTGYLRLRLHRQIEITPESNLTMSITVETVPGCEQDVSFDLSFFELTCLDLGSEDHILWGENKPDQFIRVGAKDFECAGKPIAIEAYDFSDTGKLAVTLYLTVEANAPTEAAPNTAPDRAKIAVPTSCVAHIDVWDLCAPSDHTSTDNPRPMTEPLVSLTHTLPIMRISPEDALKEAKAMVNISSAGSQIVMALRNVKKSKLATPFLIFRVQRQEGLKGRSEDAAQAREVLEGRPKDTAQPRESLLGFSKDAAQPLEGLAELPKVTARSREGPTVLPKVAAQPQEGPVGLPKVTAQPLEGVEEPPKDAAQPRKGFKGSLEGAAQPRGGPAGFLDNAAQPQEDSVRHPKFTTNRLQGFVDRAGRFMRPKNPAEQNSPTTYKHVSRTCQSLQDFFDFGSFHISDQDDTKTEKERYFTFLGSRIDVYSTSGGWKQLYSLSFGINGVPRRFDDMLHPYQSLRGRYFAWTGDLGEVSIWDFERGKCVTTIFISKDAIGVDAALSEDGSLIAISLDGSIQVHDVVSGVLLGVHEAERKDNGFERIIGRDYFMTMDGPSSTILSKNKYALGVLRVQDAKMVNVHSVFQQYGAKFLPNWDPLFSYREGATLNIKRLRNFLSPVEVHDCGPNDACELKVTPIDFYYNTRSSLDMRNTRVSSDVGADYVYSFWSNSKELTINNGCFNTTISLGPAAKDYQGFSMAASSQVVLIMNGFLQVWHLPSTADQLYELVHVEAFVEVPEAHANDSCITEVLSVQTCKNGRRFSVALKPIKWARGMNGEEVKDGLDSKELLMLTFPRTTDDTFSNADKHRYENGIASVIDTYADSDSAIKAAIIRFLSKHIRPSSKKHVSSLVILCRSWKHHNRVTIMDVIAKLLPLDKRIITWIPDINATKKEDPLSILTKTAKKSSSVLGTCEIIMEYCVDRAIESKNLTFLFPLLRNLKRIMALFPNEARDYLVRMASISLNDSTRDYVIENSIIAHSPWQHIQKIWNPSLGLDKIKDQVMQLHVTKERSRVDARWWDFIIEKIVDFSLWQANQFKMTTLSQDMIKGLVKLHVSHTSVNSFNRPIFVAAFDALWHYKDITEGKEKDPKSSTTNQQDLKNKVSSIKKLQKKDFREQGSMAKLTAAAGQADVVSQGVKITQKTTWWKTLYYMFRLKLRFRTHNYVTCHNFSLDFFNNPAIAALVEYKWNTIGFAYWAFRFFFQCVFYGLVIAAALLQVYHERVARFQLIGVFIAIIVMGVVYLWLELLQAIRNFKRYSRSMYNLVDIIAYSLPVAASIDMLVALYNNNSAANTRSLSFSVLAIFHHMLFELRIYKSVCKYVSIIRQSVVEIRVFLFIFAGGLLAFSISTLHLLRACPTPGACEVPKTKFSQHFIGAVSATFFFMGGRFDPVADELGSDDWGFHFMLGVFFFFTVIVMLNVLIALINKAFDKGNNAWRLDWIEARLQYIEIAENLSYHVPGFRETYNWFPKEIYFSSKAQEEIVRASRSKGGSSAKNDLVMVVPKAQV